MKVFILSFLLLCNAFAITPFSLEYISAVNVNILDKDKILSEEEEKKFTKSIETKLNQAGIKTDTSSFSNFLIKLKTDKVGDITVCHISLLLVEDVLISRDKPIKAIATTYSKDDFFQTVSLKEDIEESIDFLLEVFISQFQEEN
jgi:hypothetical protein